MNFSFLPDLSALAILVIILCMLHLRHPHERTDIWLLGLFFTLVEATAHTFYAPHSIPAPALHVIVMDCYLLSGLIFNWGAGDLSRPRRKRLVYLGLNALPLFAVATCYGLNVRVVRPYYPLVALGLVMGVATALYLRRSFVQACLFAAGWITMAGLVHNGAFRYGVYWGIGCVYMLAAVNFYKALPRQSTGRLAILTGFAIWSLCFLAHPLIVLSHEYAALASHVWNMQKSLISMGMILVMLEEQVSDNKWLALHDELTGLPNRRSFSDRLAWAIENAERGQGRLALFLLDLNGFKSINDTLGHAAGDLVLREIANNLRENAHFFDSLARLGGDEFTMVASDLTMGRSVSFFEDIIRRAIERPILVEGQPMTITACLGIAVYPDDARDASKLLKIADERMYGGKRKGPVGRLQVVTDFASTRGA